MVERDSGDAGLYLLDGRGPEIELGYALVRLRWGRGYATEAARALLTAAFDEFGLEDYLAKRSGWRANSAAQASEQK